MLNRLSVKGRMYIINVSILVLFVTMVLFSVSNSNGVKDLGIEKTGEVAIIRSLVDKIRYESDKSGYFLVYDGTTNVALPPKKELQGKDLAGLKDKNGVMIVQEMRDKAKSGGGFVNYIWSKPGAGDTRKLTYAEMIPGTSMWIGTGVYLDNIEAYQDQMAGEIGSMVSKRTTTMVLVSGIIFAAIIALCLFIAFGIVRALKEMVVSFQDIAEGEGDLTKRIEIASKDEIAELAGWFNTFLEKLQAMIQKSPTTPPRWITHQPSCPKSPAMMSGAPARPPAGPTMYPYGRRRDERQPEQRGRGHGTIFHQYLHGGHGRRGDDGHHQRDRPERGKSPRHFR
jgi:methyl-accepting chemotaxis protein